MSEESVIPNEPDFIVSELLSELKDENERKSALLVQKEKTLKFLTTIFLTVIIAIVGVFIWYLNQYDFTTEQTVSGVYALVDSDGNVVAQDITPEEYEKIIKEIEDGQSKN
nr:MAG TPA: hypothetical protein [Caudoviricetes sp.]